MPHPNESVIADFNTVDDEDLKAGKLPEAELNPDPPEDPERQARGEDGKFVSKDGDKKPAEEKKAPEGEKKEPEKKEEKKAPDVVPLATFLEEKNRLKAELDQRDITLKEFQKELADLKAKYEKAAPPPEEPDYIEDPKGYVDHKLTEALSKLETVNKTAEETGKKAEETARTAHAEVVKQRFLQQISAHEARFVTQNPDYHDALAHLRDIRKFQLQAFAPQMTEEQVMQTIAEEEVNLAWNLAQTGKDPVAFTYDLAKRHGYQKKAPPPPEQKAADTSRRLPPDQSLGGGQGAPDLTDASDDKPDPVDLALASLLRKRA